MFVKWLSLAFMAAVGISAWFIPFLPVLHRTVQWDVETRELQQYFKEMNKTPWIFGDGNGI